MSSDTLFDKLTDLKGKFTGFWQHRKKVKALENYSSVAKFEHKPYLELVKKCMKDGFLDKIEADFLDHVLQKYGANYLDWSHRTNWLKDKMESLKKESMPIKRALAIQEVFEFTNRNSHINIPSEILPTSSVRQSQRI